MTRVRSSKPHPLELYRLAVQRPGAQANLLANLYAYHRPGSWATLLREDYSGTAAVAAAWVAHDASHKALAVERDGPTCAWSRAAAVERLGAEVKRLQIVQADVMAVDQPRADIIAALNFSVFIHHHRDGLLAYFRHARRSLAAGGLLVIDVYGGPGAMRTGMWKRSVAPAADGSLKQFEQQWEQRSYDAATGKVDCRIHFRLPGRGGRVMRDAFVYDWRLWTIPELTETMRAAGFASTALWCDGYDGREGRSDGEYRPVESIEPREDFVAYVVGMR